ncbi:putative bifunctional diguanylate cyclase/phosphodiesterase [Streptomyces sp. CMB-StM0423]|uniref:putative bifunctional diguanylate cyclase/phosphodiesterase n=1 Tax=Streptomyces sp. CMB-StM0423 TaxID=2059884 RepID=UPI000C70B637|nr:EAL domain-containing protein [Streptomyces sp. CMB-StM0423]AUH42852.1 histidine kinase [Streptomyces sp. CMB-StM0423]
MDDFRAAFDGAQLAMAVVGGDGLVRAANSRMQELVGAGESGLAGASAAELTGLRDEPWSWAGFVDVLQGRRASLRCTRRMKDANGRSLSVEMTLTPLSGGRALLSLSDVTEQRELRAKLRHLKMHDPVTRLPNRELFFERLTGALQEARQAEEPAAEHGGAGRGRGQGGSRTRTRAAAPAPGAAGRVGLAYLDLDGFKAVNDTLGHRVGDRLLAAVARRLVACTAEAGKAEKHGITVARLGGDEFAVLVARSAGTEQLGELAQRLLDALQEPFDLAGQRLAVSASIGVVERAASGQTATALMQAADTTLYWAKADGKARWTLFDPERNAHRMTRQALSSTLRPAIERGEFTLDYQPLIDLGDGSVRGVEALVRWQHPKLGTLTPNRFIGLAEENGAIVPLGRWVLATACRRAAGWRRLRPADPVFVSVNVAVRQVWDSDLVADVAQILEETGLPPRLLQLELTESAVMGSAGRPLQALQELSEMGVGIAIDDFGTGYSNLAYLSRLPVSALKLDGSFVRGFSSAEHPSPADETIVEALVDLAHRLGISVTAECVESGEQAERLRRIGCDTAQGWFYSRAVPAERVERLL